MEECIILPPPPVNIKNFTDKYKNFNEIYKLETIIYNKNKYTFKFYHDEELAYYYLFRIVMIKIIACVHIIVYKERNICEIHNILYHDNCMPTTEMNDRKGSTLIKLALKLIDLIKDRYKIKKIFLTDNSTKQCKNKNIQLHKMLTLLTGSTWYAKYGFFPVDKILRKKFEENKKIIEKTYLKDTYLKDYLIRILKKEHQYLLEKILIDYNQAIESNSKLNIFLQFLLHNYDERCFIFYGFYQRLYEDLGLTNMGNQQFVKKIDF